MRLPAFMTDVWKDVSGVNAVFSLISRNGLP